MPIDPSYGEAAVRTLIYVGGVASTIVGSWIASKIRVYQDERRSHHEEIRKRVMEPLKEALLEHYGPLTGLSAPIVRVRWGKQGMREDVGLAQSPERTGYDLEAVDPGPMIPQCLDGVLFQDIKDKHYPELGESLEKFRKAWTDCANAHQHWVAEIAEELLSSSGLPLYEDGSIIRQRQVSPWHLAVFLYMRISQLQAGVLQHQVEAERGVLLLGNTIVAAGSTQEIDALDIVLRVTMENHKSRAAELRARVSSLSLELNDLAQRIGLAIASRRLPRRCSLVTFF